MLIRRPKNRPPELFIEGVRIEGVTGISTVFDFAYEAVETTSIYDDPEERTFARREIKSLTITIAEPIITVEEE